ncbi:MAG: S26 family signal peptidase [Thermoplasmata archaeon]|nr:S26 family signal peptidase [Thermoplasmata archaeon]MCI4359112.1 S26 family signal peptidase [Thermoplasmata archaeon]
MFFRASDTVWFEPLVALAIVVLILVSLYAYTSNWPPAYVIESDSMQHGLTDQVGLINTGDLVLAQRLNASQVTTYFAGLESGYRTYGEYGDVILYHANGNANDAPIIHRALAYIEYNAGNRTYSIPELQGLPCGSQSDAVYRVSAHLSGCGTLGITGPISLLDVGWMGAEVNVTLSNGVVGAHSGFLTMGDNNLAAGTPPRGAPDQPTLSLLVQSDWVVGVARGMIPWFGSLKLLLSGDAGMVPTQSWEWLAITVIGTLLAAMGIHYALRAEGIEDDRRKEDEREDDDEEGSRPGRRWHSLVPWRRSREDDLDDDDEEEAGHRPRSSGRPRPEGRRERGHDTHVAHRGGRPRPRVGRSRDRPRHRHRPPDDDL